MKNIKELYDNFTSLNSDNNLKLAKKLAKELNIKKDIPREEILSERLVKSYSKKYLLFGKLEEGVVDRYSIRVILDKNNRLIITKEYNDDTDYEMSLASCIDWSTSQQVVNIKLKDIL
jgi:hypothetical protein